MPREYAFSLRVVGREREVEVVDRIEFAVFHDVKIGNACYIALESLQR